MGLFLFVDSGLKLLRREHPSIGSMMLFGREFWAGWAMIVALFYSMCIGIMLGRMKKPVAKVLHSKALIADATSNSAEWQSEGAAIIGITLVGFGLWWGDAMAALFISLEVIREAGSAFGSCWEISWTKAPRSWKTRSSKRCRSACVAPPRTSSGSNLRRSVCASTGTPSPAKCSSFARSRVRRAPGKGRRRPIGERRLAIARPGGRLDARHRRRGTAPIERLNQPKGER
jgi:hypothetical protein